MAINISLCKKPNKNLPRRRIPTCPRARRQAMLKFGGRGAMKTRLSSRGRGDFLFIENCCEILRNAGPTIGGGWPGALGAVIIVALAIGIGRGIHRISFLDFQDDPVRPQCRREWCSEFLLVEASHGEQAGNPGGFHGGIFSRLQTQVPPRTWGTFVGISDACPLKRKERGGPDGADARAKSVSPGNYFPRAGPEGLAIGRFIRPEEAERPELELSCNFV